MPRYLVSIKTAPDEYTHFKVDKEVYSYIHQLENAIRHPEHSKLKEVYPERFPS